MMLTVELRGAQLFARPVLERLARIINGGRAQLLPILEKPLCTAPHLFIYSRRRNYNLAGEFIILLVDLNDLIATINYRFDGISPCHVRDKKSIHSPLFARQQGGDYFIIPNLIVIQRISCAQLALEFR